MAKNANLIEAKKAKNDEFYTLLENIEAEMKHYKNHFRGKVVYCNCDDPRESQFFHYFSYNFESLGLKKLIATCYKNQSANLFSTHDSDRAVYLVYEGDKNGNRIPDAHEIKYRMLEGDGDFRSPECIEFLKEADIVVTNPPFSLFREYVAQLMEYKKKFIIIGNINAVICKDLFPFMKNNEMWLGASGRVQEYRVPDNMELRKISRTDENGHRYTKVPTATWFTNLTHKKRNEEINLFMKYNEKDYPHYDNYGAIEVSKVKNIPLDWDGVMGVPLTFLEKYNPKQFEIVNCDWLLEKTKIIDNKKDRFYLNGRRLYSRIAIRKISA